jgi:hypothetical protein
LTYYVNDQYGSVRAGMSETAVLTKLEYYPYGEVYSMSGGGSVYTFLGKEDPGVGMLDFGPRYYLYDPSGMFTRYPRSVMC